MAVSATNAPNAGPGVLPAMLILSMSFTMGRPMKLRAMEMMRYAVRSENRTIPPTKMAAPQTPAMRRNDQKSALKGWVLPVLDGPRRGDSMGAN
jgi:hypothetical protein